MPKPKRFSYLFTNAAGQRSLVMKGWVYRDVYATEDGPTTGTGKTRWERGERLVLQCSGDMVFVFEADVSDDDVRCGKGLLFTYRGGDRIELDGKRLK